MQHLADPDRVRHVDARAEAAHVHAGRHLLPRVAAGPAAADSNGQRDRDASRSAAIESHPWRRHRHGAGTVPQSESAHETISRGRKVAGVGGREPTGLPYASMDHEAGETRR